MEARGDYLRQVVESYEQRLAHKRAHPTTRSGELGTLIMKNYFEMVWRAREEGKPLAWVSFGVPVEIFYAMDIVPFLVEQFAITVVVQGFREGKGFEYFDYGIGAGFSKEACTAHIVPVGMAKAGELPPPQVAVCASVPCDSSLMTFEVLTDIYKCPSFWMDYPYMEREGGIEFFKKEFADLIRFLEEHTGHKLDPDRLKETLEISRQTNEYYAKILELRKTAPAPFGGREGWNIIMNIRYVDGLPETLEYFKAFYEETRDKVARGESHLAEERHRLIWVGGYPFFFMRIIDWVEEQYQAVVVGEAQSSVKHRLGGDTSDPLGFLARKAAGFGIWRVFGEFGTITPELVEQAQALKADAAIYFASTGCKQGCGITRLLRDTWGGMAGLPTLILDGDVLDPRVTSVAQIKDQLAKFFAMLEGR